MNKETLFFTLETVEEAYWRATHNWYSNAPSPQDVYYAGQFLEMLKSELTKKHTCDVPECSCNAFKFENGKYKGEF